MLRTAVAGAVLIVLLWFGDHVAYPHDKRNPASNPAHSVWVDGRVPEKVRGILARSCMDCHSNEVRWPYLSRLPLVSMIFEDDVFRARKQMNLSEWVTLRGGDKDDVQGILNGICEETRIQNMPPRRYVVMHAGTLVSAQESEALCEWAGSPIEYAAGHKPGPEVDRAK